jgi:hypothetical protein
MRELYRGKFSVPRVEQDQNAGYHLVMNRRDLMEAIKHLTMTELEAGMPYIHQAPKDQGIK